MIKVIGQFEVKPAFRSQFKEALMTVKKGSVEEPGCLGIRLFEDKQNPNMFFGYELFTGEEAVAFHRSQPYELKLAELANEALVNPPKAYVLIGEVSEEKGVEEFSSTANSAELRVIALFDIKADENKKLIAQYEKQIPNVRAQDDCVSFNAYTVLEKPNQLVVIEEWKTQEFAQKFSTTDALSMETGKVLSEIVERPIPEYLHQVNEI